MPATVMTASDTRSVSLAIPAKAEYLVLARLALSAVCRLTPLEAGDVADLKLAITEAATTLVDAEAPGRIEFSFELDRARLVLELSGTPSEALSADERALGQAIIEATVDEWSFDEGRVQLVKYLETTDE